MTQGHKKVKTFPSTNSQERTKTGLYSSEIVFGFKPKILTMFNLSSTTKGFGNLNPTQRSPCQYFPKHTHADQIDQAPQTKRLQKVTFAHWFLYREKTHSDV